MRAVNAAHSLPVRARVSQFTLASRDRVFILMCYRVDSLAMNAAPGFLGLDSLGTYGGFTRAGAHARPSWRGCCAATRVRPQSLTAPASRIEVPAHAHVRLDLPLPRRPPPFRTAGWPSQHSKLTAGEKASESSGRVQGSRHGSTSQRDWMALVQGSRLHRQREPGATGPPVTWGAVFRAGSAPRRRAVHATGEPGDDRRCSGGPSAREPESRETGPC